MTHQQKDKLPKPAVAAIKPTAAAAKRLNVLVKLGSRLVRPFLKRYVQEMTIIGAEHLKTGPALVMMNHSNVLDPLLLTIYLGQPIHFMVTEPFMADRLIARIFAKLGQIPKRKIDFDTQSIRTMKQWCQLGSIVGIFPEGHFPWDGHPLPLQPGLSQLVSYLDVPVVTVRLVNGDRFWPPWAKNIRRTRLSIEIDPPKYFEPGEDIEQYVASHIAVNPDSCERWPVFGKGLAEGLAQLLRFCPKCGSDDYLLDNNDELHCNNAACRSRWLVCSDNCLYQHDKEALSITAALARIKEQLKQQWAGDSPYFRGRGTVDVLDCSHTQWKHLASGTLELKQGLLSIDSWHLNINEVSAHTLDWGNIILLRTRRQRIALKMPNDSRALWTFVINQANGQQEEIE